MLRPRIIPCLLVHQGGLVKTRAFKEPKYVGDPINAVKIFNEKEADELIVLDIDASVSGAEPNYTLIAKLAAECRMPLCYGGGITTAEQAARIIDLGVEKVSISAAACTHNASRAQKADPIEFAQRLEQAGAGEIVVNAIDRDGQMAGYDLELAEGVRRAIRVPLTVLGGAGSLEDMAKLIQRCGVVGAAAGSLFVFKGAYRAVLINYPNPQQREQIARAAR